MVTTEAAGASDCGASEAATPCRKRPKSGGTGIQYTELGQPFVSGWPSSRPVPDLGKYPRQSIEEAAERWTTKATMAEA